MIEKNRTYELSFSSKQHWDVLETRLTSLPGINEVHLVPTLGSLTVTYDLLKIESKRIEDAITLNGTQLRPHSFFQRIKRGFVHFLEENERDNYKARPSGCCAGMPAGEHGLHTTNRNASCH